MGDEGMQEYAIGLAIQSAGAKIKWEPVEPWKKYSLKVQYNKEKNMWKFAKK